MPPASQPGMQSRLSSSSSSPSLAGASSSTPRSSIAPAPAPLPSSSSSTGDDGSSDASPSARNDSSSGGRPTPGRRQSSSASPAAPSRSSLFSRPGLLSRLSLPIPLRTRNSNVADFHIQPLETHRKYTAGDHVRGSVILVIVKPVRITHLTVALTGYVRVHKDPALAVRAQSVAPSLLPHGSSEKPQYRGNGFASLFQDEQVLSGDGRLEAGKYEFGFDLVFPSKNLPSSIDFERGSISYMISATLTRPTSIAATTTCDRKVTLVEKVDIGLIRVPSPRTIFLEPVSKRTRRKKSMTLDKVASATPETTSNDIASDTGSAVPSVETEDSSRDRPPDARYPDHSDVRSEFSGESSRSVSTGCLSRAELAQVASAKQQVVDDKTITATVELLKGGCLPGDTVSVRVSVQHIKPIKSMTGVIVTLFRQGKINSAPDSTAFLGKMSKVDKKRMEREEAYPKSKTGIAGLSLSSTSSTSIFRKDLDQNSAPLIINPATLQTSVTVSVKVPDDSFPSIKGVPGNMIAFSYRLEVIVDLGGRLSNRLTGSKDSRLGQLGNSTYEGSGNSYSPRRGQSIADTAPLRREKGVIAVNMETVVGTTDSYRGQARPRVSASSRTLRTTLSEDDEAYPTEYSQPEDSHNGTPYTSAHPSNGYFAAQHGSHRYWAQPPPHQPPASAGPSHHPQTLATSGDGSDASPAYIPAPQLPDEQNMSEKERIRQAETRLLPSQPPAGPSSLPDDENVYDADDTPRLPHASPSSPREDHDGEAPSAPTQDDLSRPAANWQPGEDKQELERRRLLNEASAPPEMPEDHMDRRQGESSRRDMAPDAEPSAPVLREEDEEEGFGYRGYGVGAGPSSSGAGHHSEQLPAYER